MRRLYSDENFPLPVVEELRRLGFDVITMYDDETANQAVPDEIVLSIATENLRAVLTTNRRDFIRLHRKHPKHGGIIVCTFDPDFGGQARRIAEALQKEITLSGQLIRVYRPA